MPANCRTLEAKPSYDLRCISVGPLARKLYVAYFASHIPITMFIDSQALLPRALYPQIAAKLLDFHVETNGDFLMGAPPTWFRSLILVEVALQLPFFFVACRSLLAKTEARLRWAFVAYGSHVATTMVPILGEILLRADAAAATRARLALIYLPYLVVPLCIVASFSATPHIDKAA